MMSHVSLEGNVQVLVRMDVCVHTESMERKS